MIEKGYILVADDDEEDLALTVAALTQCQTGKELVTVRDGVEVLECLYAEGSFKDRPPGNPELLLLDLNMPLIDGWSVLQRIREDERLRTVPVVAFTSSSRSEDVEKCYRLGANACVTKPNRADAFGSVVRRIQAFWIHRPEPGPLPGEPAPSPAGKRANS